MSFPTRCVVVDKKVIGVRSGFRKTLHGFLVRLWNRAQWYGLPSVTHPNHDSPSIQIGVFRGDEDTFVVNPAPLALSNNSVSTTRSSTANEWCPRSIAS